MFTDLWKCPNRAVALCGLIPIALAGALFVAFPLYRMPDGNWVRQALWNPPRVVIREAGWGLAPDEIARLEQDPRQREIVDKLKEPYIFQPSPNWLGYSKLYHNKRVAGRAYPTNSMLYLFAGSIAAYFIMLKYRGIL